MKIYILDDDDAIIHTLRNIVDDYSLGEVVGYSQDPKKAIREIEMIKPDILLVDLLMDAMDGIEVISAIKKHNLKIIMISQVIRRELISDAYKKGIEFFINKPINIIEVVNVIRNTIDKIKSEKKLKHIESLFNQNTQIIDEKTIEKSSDENYIKFILNKIGIIESNGGEDILKLYLNYKKEKNKNLDIYKIIDKISKNPNAMKQRIRRAIKKSLNNIATLGIEDYFNPVFTDYSSALFEFKEVKREMDYLRNKTNKRGSINIEKFIYGLSILKELNN